MRRWKKPLLRKTTVGLIMKALEFQYTYVRYEADLTALRGLIRVARNCLQGGRCYLTTK